MTISHVNDSSRPVILIGSNLALFYIKDTCRDLGITIHGIIDSDYYNNTAEIEGIPVIGDERLFDDESWVALAKEKYSFFIATNYLPQKNSVDKRNVQKRFWYIDLVEALNLYCISLVHPGAVVHDTCTIGKGVFIENLAYIAGYNEIGDFSCVHSFVITGHHNKLGKNCVLQRKAGLYDFNTLEDNVFVGMNSQIAGESITIGQGTIVHACMVVRRSTQPNEVISLVGKDLRKIYAMPSEDLG
jgi:acetyltransferase-like isoleucine patch superfamily enzyme